MSDLGRIIPTLVYQDITAAHDFLVAVFGFESGGVDCDPSGVPVHAEVRSNGQVIWLHRVVIELNLVAQNSLPGASSGLVVHLVDVDAHCERARRAGALIDREPQDMPYGQREYSVRDLEGHRWWFATPSS
jgi:uncharacterized glyoxalase superfamily protein PhnB